MVSASVVQNRTVVDSLLSSSFFLVGFAILKDFLYLLGAKSTDQKFHRWRHVNWPIGEWGIFDASPDTAYVNLFYPSEFIIWFKSTQAKQVDLATVTARPHWSSLFRNYERLTCSKSMNEWRLDNMCAACGHVVVYGQSMILSWELIENFIQNFFQALAWKSRAVSAYFCSTVSSSSDSESDTFALPGLFSEVLQAFHSFSSIWKQKQTHVEPLLIVIRDLKILKQEQLRIQDFLITR